MSDALTADEVITIITPFLSESEFTHALVYWNTACLAPGDSVCIGNRDLAITEPGMWVFMDLMPEANWAHPCRYLLITLADRSVTPIEGHLPPFRGGIPDTVQLVLRYGKRPANDRDFRIFDS